MGQVAAPLMIASSLVSAGSSIMSGNARAKQLRSEAGTQMYNAKLADLSVKQISAQRSGELAAAIGAIETGRADRGLSLGSPTAFAISDAVTREHLSAQRADELDARLQGQSYRAQARASLKAAKQAKIAGYVGALGSVLEAGSRAASMGGTPGGSRGGSLNGHSMPSAGRLR